MSLHLVLLLLAFLCVTLAAFDLRAPRVNLFALGVAFWLLDLLLAMPR